MGEALYRKYRSKSLDEVVGQEHVTTTLKNALNQGKISHAYLLTGPRGTGKTSIARILAHAINDIPYSTDTQLDIIEIDAASNRRIDEIRDIRDKVHIAPTSLKYKIYIIDEVHMLTKEAFNALLKTLEEPPAHVIFILATTEVHKLPETIISRTQRFNLKPIADDPMMSHLAQLAKSEGVTIAQDALNAIASHSHGGLRDAISLFDQLSSHSNDITKTDVERLLGVAADEHITSLMEALLSGSPAAVVEILQNLQEQGIHAPQIAAQLSEAFRQTLIEEPPKNADQVIELLGRLVEIPASRDPYKSLEITLIGFALKQSPSSESAPKSVIHNVVESKPVEQEKPAGPKEAKPLEIVTPPTITKPITLGKEISKENWNTILQAIKQKHNTLYGVVRMAKPTLADQTLTLQFSFPFHQKRMNEAKNRQLIQDVVKQVTGTDLTIECTISSDAKPLEPEPSVSTPQDSATLDTITDIFGGGEVLES